jgi:radical SAM-linked protein
MRIRIKFSKDGSLKYIGHLDVMRFFQKAVRRAGLDVVYSEGFSPHMLMSFAQPLGVGVTSEGEYFDLDLKTADTSEHMKKLLNAQMPEEIKILEIVKIPEDKANKCMTLVAAADYEISFDGADTEQIMAEFDRFMERDEISILKKTKKNEVLTDIKPMIFSYGFKNGVLELRLSSGSVNNLKPQLVIDAFCNFAGIDTEGLKVKIHRKELYAGTDAGFVPLYRMGEEIV